MKHYNFEFNKPFDQKDFINYLNDAKLDVAIENGKDEIEFELAESIVNKRFNDFVGVFEKYRILKSGNVIGFLEAFKNNNLNYLSIYTSPL